MEFLFDADNLRESMGGITSAIEPRYTEHPTVQLSWFLLRTLLRWNWISARPQSEERKNVAVTKKNSADGDLQQACSTSVHLIVEDSRSWQNAAALFNDSEKFIRALKNNKLLKNALPRTKCSKNYEMKQESVKRQRPQLEMY